MNDAYPNRKSIRLKEYDYSKNGYYFVTICAFRRESILCSIIPPKDSDPTELLLTPIGAEIKKSILYLPDLFSGLTIDQYCIMPNHVHILLTISKIKDDRMDREGVEPLPYESLPTIIGRLKSYTTNLYRKMQKHNSILWQRSYYEHVIRNEKELSDIRQYILNNALKWSDDEYFR